MISLIANLPYKTWGISISILIKKKLNVFLCLDDTFDSRKYEYRSGIIGIFVLLQYENDLELVTSDISFNSVSP